MADEKIDPYPEHTKLLALNGANQIAGDFVDWLRDEKGFEFTTFDEESGDPRVDYTPTRALLAEFFEIDEQKIEAEKQQMLRSMRGES